MNDDKKYWDSIFSDDEGKLPSYDGWLTKYLHILKSAEVIVDLGCGTGGDVLALWKLGIKAIACDFSYNALQRVKSMIPDIQIICFDMSMPFPFINSFADVIIADLSLHYFSSNTTKAICKEIERVLKKSGVLICRVNSIKDYSPGKSDMQIENNYIFTDGYTRRYFDIPEINRLFSAFRISNVSEYTINKYGDTKYVFEFIAAKA